MIDWIYTLTGWLTQGFNAWLHCAWPVALLVAVVFHVLVYLGGGGIGALLTFKLLPWFGFGRPIDTQPLKLDQVRIEVRHGLATCLIIAGVTLSYRPLAHGIWPDSIWAACWQAGAFLLFNNVYSYFTHRLLHTRALLRYHGVHHWSRRVTTWSGYSVHPVEAVVIAGTFPLFMALVPVGIGTVAVLHVLGMVFTACIHSNYDFMPNHPDNHWLKRLISDPKFHQAHHVAGNVNYGFTSPLLDLVFGTLKK